MEGWRQLSSFLQYEGKSLLCLYREEEQSKEKKRGRKKEEGRRKKEEGKRKKEEGRRSRKEAEQRVRVEVTFMTKLWIWSSSSMRKHVIEETLLRSLLNVGARRKRRRRRRRRKRRREREEFLLRNNDLIMMFVKRRRESFFELDNHLGNVAMTRHEIITRDG